MFPFSESGPIHLAAWVQVGNITFQAEIIDADGASRTAQVIRLGTYPVQTIPFAAIASVSLREGNYVLRSFGRPPAAMLPEWVRYAEVVS